MLSAATIANVGTKSISAVIQKMFPHAEYISLASMHRPVSTVQRQFEWTCSEEVKKEKLKYHLNRLRHSAALVFVRSVDRADLLAEFLANNGYSCAAFHKKIDGAERTELLDGIRSGKYQALICTDLAARGLDLQSIRLVIEYDFALNVTEHLHRIGRTARAGMPGTVVSFIDQTDHDLAKAIGEHEGARVDELFSRNRSFRRRIHRKTKTIK